jgi:hypothetical protein
MLLCFSSSASFLSAFEEIGATAVSSLFFLTAIGITEILGCCAFIALRPSKV